MTHGDGVMSNSFAGIPFYGMRNRREAIQALMSQMGQKRLDMLLMGHFHQYVDWKGECDIVINPSIKGGDEFGMSTRYQAPEAMQLLMEWHPEHGRTATNYINLDQIR
jgi:predicted phosphodiesterase